MNERTIRLTDFLDDVQIAQCCQLQKAAMICKTVIAPNIDEINRKLGQKNDPMYLAYCCERVVGLTVF